MNKIEKTCPVCNLPMQVKTSTGGEDKGKQFYVCPNYKTCGQVIQLPEFSDDMMASGGTETTQTTPRTDKSMGALLQFSGILLGVMLVLYLCAILGFIPGFSMAKKDVKIGEWGCLQDVYNWEFSGTVSNIGNSDIGAVELRVTLRDSAGNDLATTTGFVNSDVIRPNSSSTFAIFLPKAGTEIYTNADCYLGIESASYR